MCELSTNGETSEHMILTSKLWFHVNVGLPEGTNINQKVDMLKEHVRERSVHV